MNKLRVVGSSPDHSQLILSNKPKGRQGTHAVAIDKRLLGVLQDAVYARREAARQARLAGRAAQPRPEPKFPPKEIQRQLRAGRTPQQVAHAAGVPVNYVEQFIGAVLYERDGVIRDAQAQYVGKPRLGSSGLPLGDAVARNLVSRRVGMSDEAYVAAWTAVRDEGEPWTVAFTFPYRGRSRRAAWRWDPRARALTAANKLAVEIGWVANGRRRAAAAAARKVELAASASPDGRARSTKRAAKRAGPKRAARKPARKAAAKRTARRKRAAKKRRAAPKRVARKPARRAAPKRAAKKRAAKKRAAPKRAATSKRAAPKRRTARRTATRRR